MTAEDSLARLRAGLDEDERIARAAAAQSPEWTDGYEGEAWAHGNSDILGVHTLSQVERHSPVRTLRQVEAIRRLIAEFDEIAPLDDFDRGFADGLDRALEILASIYPDPTEES